MDAATVSAPLPRITIKFCTQCKWMLRAAYFAQELLSTFSTSLGEVALQPSTGGVFTIEIISAASSNAAAPAGDVTVLHKVLWDRKSDGGFPEVKELKRRVRDIIEPSRDLGHIDRATPTPTPSPPGVEAGARTASVGRGGAEEEELEHEEMSLRVQPGGERYERVGEEGGGGEEETGVGVPPGGAGEGEAGKRNFDGTACEDCV